MGKKKTEEKEDKPSPKKTVKSVQKNVVIDVEKYSISELLEMNKLKPLNAVGFLNYYGLVEDFRKEIENKESVVKFSKGEFDDMYERYNKREI